MVEAKNSNLEEELKRQEKLILGNPEASNISSAIDANVALRDKLLTGQWLDREDLESLDLDDKTIEDYLSAKEMIQVESKKGPEDIAAEYIAKQNDNIVMEKKKIERAMTEAAEKTEAQKILKEIAKLAKEMWRLDSEDEYKFVLSTEGNSINNLHSLLQKAAINLPYERPSDVFRDFKESVLAELTSDEIIRQGAELMNLLGKIVEVRKTREERLARVRYEESIIGRLRKRLGIDKE